MIIKLRLNCSKLKGHLFITKSREITEAREQRLDNQVYHSIPACAGFLKFIA